MDDHVIDKRPFAIEQRGILCLPDGQPRSVIHGNMLHRGQSLRPGQANVAHVADVENTHAGAHGHVLVDNSAADGRGILHRHVPAVEFHHLRAHLAMDSVQRSFSDGCGAGGRRLRRRQNRPQSASSGWPAGIGVTDYRITRFFCGSNGRRSTTEDTEDTEED